MARTDSAKIKQFKKPLNINLGMIFFGVIFIYLLVCIFLYFTTKHVAGYQVKTGSLFVNNVYTGMMFDKLDKLEAAHLEIVSGQPQIIINQSRVR